MTSILIASCNEGASVGAKRPIVSGPREGQILVLDELDAPEPDTRLLVNGSPVTTGPDGYASVPRLPSSYDVMLMPDRILYGFQGLRSRAPAIKVPFISASRQIKVGTLVVLLPEGSPLNRRVAVLATLGGPEILKQKTGFTFDELQNTTIIRWVGPQTVPLTAEAFLFDIDPGTGFASSFVGYSRMSQNIRAGARLDWNPTFTQIPYDPTEINVHVALPNGMKVDDYNVIVRNKSGGGGQFPGLVVAASGDVDAGPRNDVSLLLPDFPSSVFDVSVVASNSETVAVATIADLLAGSKTSIDITQRPVAISPDEAAVGNLSEMEFSWTNENGDISYLYAYSDSFDIACQIAGPRSTASIPDVSLLAPSPKAGAWRWEGRVVSGPESMDDYASGTAVVSWAYTRTRSFTAVQR